MQSQEDPLPPPKVQLIQKETPKPVSVEADFEDDLEQLFKNKKGDDLKFNCPRQKSAFNFKGESKKRLLPDELETKIDKRLKLEINHQVFAYLFKPHSAVKIDVNALFRGKQDSAYPILVRDIFEAQDYKISCICKMTCSLCKN